MSLSGKRILFLGDSITQNGQYVSFLSYYLQKQYPNNQFDIISIGLGSETVSCLTENDHPFPRPCLEERLTRALEKIQPEIIFASYGMNDGIYHPQSTDRFEAYQKGIEALKQAAKEQGAALILMSPPPFDALPIQEKLAPDTATEFSYRSPYAAYDEELGDYSSWLQTQKTENLDVIDLHSGVNAYINKKRVEQPQFSFSQDGIHPNAQGHLLMATIILDHYGITVDSDLDMVLSTLKDDELYTKIEKKRRLLSEAWLPYIGYIRGDTVSTSSIDDAILKQVETLEKEISPLLQMD